MSYLSHRFFAIPALENHVTFFLLLTGSPAQPARKHPGKIAPVLSSKSRTPARTAASLDVIFPLRSPHGSQHGSPQAKPGAHDASFLAGSLAGSRAGCHAGCEAGKKRQGRLPCGLACGMSKIEPVLFSRRVSLRAEPQSQSEARKMSRDSRGRG